MIINCKNKTFDFNIDAPPSKSIYHRELIVRFLLMDAAGSDVYDRLSADLSILPEDNEDIRATKSVLTALHAASTVTDDSETKRVYLPCNESGSTLRFMIPVAAAFILGKGRDSHGVTELVFETKGRLFDRPLDELEDALKPHGINIEKNEADRSIIVTGSMTPGEYTIDGSVSSQYISGLLMALTIFEEPCTVNVTGTMKSIHYIGLTQDVLDKYGCPSELKGSVFYPKTGGYINSIKENQTSDDHLLLDDFKVEGDWSNGAFLLCLQKWSDIKVNNLNPDSRQGDRAILDYLKLVDDVRTGKTDKTGVTWDCSDIPDITPYMAVVAPFVFNDICFTGVSRLRIKESDRVKAVREQLAAAGIRTEESEDTLTVYGCNYDPSSPDGDKNTIRLSSYNDHRMAMCAVLLATILKTEIELDDISCMKKSFPEFLGYIEKYYA